jgi:hypothetical protein
VRLLLISALAAALVGCSSAPQQMHPGLAFADRGLYQTHYEQSSQVHSQRRASNGRTNTANKTNARNRKNNNSTKIMGSHVLPKIDASSSDRPNDKSNVVITTPSSATKTDNPPSSQFDDEAKKREVTPSSHRDDGVKKAESSQRDNGAKKTEVPPSSQLDDGAKKAEVPPSSQRDNGAKKTEVPPSSQLDDESVIKKAKATIAPKMSDPNSVEFDGIERGRKNARGNSIETVCGFVRDKNGGPKAFLYLVQTDEAYIGGYNIASSDVRNICSGK